MRARLVHRGAAQAGAIKHHTLHDTTSNTRQLTALASVKATQVAQRFIRYRRRAAPGSLTPRPLIAHTGQFTSEHTIDVAEFLPASCIYRCIFEADAGCEHTLETRI